MSSLFVKGMLLKSVEETYSFTRLKQRRGGENSDIRGLDHHRQHPFLGWIHHGNLSAARRIESQVRGSIPLQAVLNPVSPVVPTTKKEFELPGTELVSHQAPVHPLIPRFDPHGSPCVWPNLHRPIACEQVHFNPGWECDHLLDHAPEPGSEF